MAKIKLTAKQKKQIAASMIYQILENTDDFALMDTGLCFEDQEYILKLIKKAASKFIEPAGDALAFGSTDAMINHFASINNRTRRR